MARRNARPAGRGAVPAGRIEPRVRGEVGAIALVAFALLSLVALITEQGQLLHWWRSLLLTWLGWGALAVPVVLGLAAAALWWPGLRARLVLPLLGGTLSLVGLLGLLYVVGLGDSPVPGLVGQSLGKTIADALGTAGAAVVLLAVLAVGVVVAANRTLAELVAPAVRRGPPLALRPGTTLRGSGALGGLPRPQTQQVAGADAQQLKINLPGGGRPQEQADQRVPSAVAVAPATAAPTAPAPEAKVARAASAAEEAAETATKARDALAGLPSAAVAAEGVLHADPAQRPWVLPPHELLETGQAGRSGTDEVVRNSHVIEETLAHFSIAAKVVEVSVGPVVTRYELKPAAGVKLSRIEALADDLSLALAARSLRIEAPIPGKSVVGIEIPNIAIGLVSLRDVAETAQFRDASSRLAVGIGRDLGNQPIVLDLAKLPHLLVAGQTGSGKSVCISAMLCSLLLQASPDQVRLLVGDLKRVDFAVFDGIPHLIAPVMREAPQILNALYWTVGEMDRRYRLFARRSARNIAAYNEKATGPDRVPYVIFVIDELADLMLQAPIQVEKQITRIAQLARATGIHLVLGTQRPSVDVITGLIKANIPARIAFATASAVDSRTILDMTGAEKLLGRGDMLVLPPDLAKPIRAQGVFVSDADIAALTKHWRDQARPVYHEEVIAEQERLRAREENGDEMDDDRYEEAVEIVRRAGQASVSMLQRKMTIGFARAGRLIDLMERNGVIGPSKGPGKMREVYGAAPGRRPSMDEGEAEAK